jgi:broad specificity phosphatase PhoE
MADEDGACVQLLHLSETADLPLGSFKRVIFVRHGQTYYNLACTGPDGQEGLVPIGGPDGTMGLDHSEYFDGTLTEKGEQQAQQAALALADKVELVLVSPLERAIRTALLMFPDPPGGKLVAHEGMREIMYKQAVYTKRITLSEKQQRYPSKVDFSCISTDEDALFDSLASFCETRQAVLSRASRCLRWLQTREESCVVVVCHGLVMRSIFANEDGAETLQVSPSLGLHWTPNCVIHEAALLLPHAATAAISQ